MLTSPKAAEPVGRRVCRSAVSYGRRVCRSDLKSGQLSRRHFPGVNSPGLSGDIHTNFGNLQPFFHFVGDEVVFVVDLPEGGIRRAVHLELEDVDPVLSPADGVRPADGRLDFTLNIIPQQREDQVDDGLVVLLRLVFQVIRNAVKDTKSESHYLELNPDYLVDKTKKYDGTIIVKGKLSGANFEYTSEVQEHFVNYLKDVKLPKSHT